MSVGDEAVHHFYFLCCTALDCTALGWPRITTDNTGWISAAHYKVHYFTVTLLVNLSPRGFWLLSHGPSIIQYCRQPAIQSVSQFLGDERQLAGPESDRQYNIALLGGSEESQTGMDRRTGIHQGSSTIGMQLHWLLTFIFLRYNIWLGG